MLELTVAAARFIEEARRQQGLPEWFGLRITSTEATPIEQVQLIVVFAEHPADDDDVLEQAGTRMFVARPVAQALRHANAAISVMDTSDGTALVLVEHPRNGAV
jgi:Fe-S cluster assembly iron-binding protein IscA